MLYNPMTNRLIGPNAVEYYTREARREQTRAFAHALDRVFGRR
ncbi:hypothetical protein [Zhengella mangrovi]|nr:hypothetical protein [Zhengella mangrovi]